MDEQAIQINKAVATNGDKGLQFLPFFYQNIELLSSTNNDMLSHCFQYRISPFTNTMVLQKDSNMGNKCVKHGGNQSNHDKSKRSYRWLPSINSAKWQERYLFPVMDLSRALQGFLVFELIWKDVHGINYLNELQVSME